MLKFKGLPGEEEYHLMYQTRNPLIPGDTEFIWVLSSRHDIFQRHLNCSQQSVNFPVQDGKNHQCDIADDFKRIEGAFTLGKQLFLKRRKEFQSDDNELYPLIIYNGWPEQNTSFREAIKAGLKSLDLIDYPASRILIIDLADSKDIHTGTQFNNLAEKIKTEPLLEKLKQGKNSIAIVTSAYHIPRVRRYFSSPIYTNPFSQETKITFHAIDRKFMRPCARADLKGELQRISKYQEAGFIGKEGVGNWFDARALSLRKWTPLRESLIQSLEVSECDKKQSNSRDRLFRFHF